MRNDHFEIEIRVVGEKGGEWTAPSMSGWRVWCFPGERAQVSVQRRSVLGKSQCSVELKQVIV